MSAQANRRAAFTLVELLTVVAIITLLIGILIPSLSAARDQAKRAKTAAQISGFSKGAEMFLNDNKQKYPRSSGVNPFEDADHPLSGAQWLTLQLVGADLSGWIKPEEQNDSNKDGIIDFKDWRDWYKLNPSRAYARQPLYANVDAKSAMSMATYLTKNTNLQLPGNSSFKLGSSDWKNERVPFFVDAFNFPIIYYAANTQENVCQVYVPNGTGRYDQSDNAAITGSEGGAGRNKQAEDGLDLTGAGKPHPFKKVGFNGKDTRPDKDTFAERIMDENIFKTTEKNGKGRVWPVNPEGFLIISPGKDGLFGTPDDIQNFTR